jgi:hypothetical protein
VSKATEIPDGRIEEEDVDNKKATPNTIPPCEDGADRTKAEVPLRPSPSQRPITVGKGTRATGGDLLLPGERSQDLPPE